MYIKLKSLKKGLDLPSKYKQANDMVSGEPVTPKEVAQRLGLNYKTAKDGPMRLAVMKKGCAPQKF
jgi:hypothetical protein